LVLAHQDDRYIPAFFGRGGADATLDEIEQFATGTRTLPRADRVLATGLFTDIGGSTRLAAELGDQRWGQVLENHHALVRRQLDRFRGKEVKVMGDGFLATFDGPAHAIACTIAIRDATRQIGRGVRAGLHTGEIEIGGSDIAGRAVHIGQRVSSFAEPGEVLVSRTVVDLVVGSGMQFSDRGGHELKGVPGLWRIFAVET
jgi:class 3 adenylate cyclase